MDQANDPFSDRAMEPLWQGSGFETDPRIRIRDKRVAELLLLLHQLDQSLGALEELPKTGLTELVSDAIAACGFVDPDEARYAIAAVLEMIGVPPFDA